MVVNKVVEKSRYWCFTLHPKPGQVIPSQLPDGARYCVYQKEVGEGGKEHYQGYIEFDEAVRAGQRTEWVKMFIPGGHTEVKYAKREQARHYCMKPCSTECNQDVCIEARSKGNGRIAWKETRPTELGVFGEITQGKRTDICIAKEVVRELGEGKSVKDVVMEYPTMIRCYNALSRFYDEVHTEACFRDVKTVVIWGDSGCGKTECAWKYDDKLYSKPEGDWFHKYKGQKTMLLDDFYGGIKYHEMLKLLDKYPYDVPTKGSFVGARWEKVFITSNKDPRDWYSSKLQENMIRRLHEVYYVRKVDGIGNDWFRDDLRTGVKVYVKSYDVEGKLCDRCSPDLVYGEPIEISEDEFRDFMGKKTIKDYY